MHLLDTFMTDLRIQSKKSSPLNLHTKPLQISCSREELFCLFWAVYIWSSSRPRTPMMVEISGDLWRQYWRNDSQAVYNVSTTSNHTMYGKERSPNQKKKYCLSKPHKTKKTPSWNSSISSTRTTHQRSSWWNLMKSIQSIWNEWRILDRYPNEQRHKLKKSSLRD